MALPMPQAPPRATPKGAPTPVRSRAIGPTIQTIGLTTEAVSFRELIVSCMAFASASPLPTPSTAFF